MEDEIDDEIDDEMPSLPLLQASLASTDADVRQEAARQISAFVSEAYGEEGAELGAALREGGIVSQLAGLVGDESAEVRAHALLALGNLCSDSVDPNSSSTKALLLELGMEKALLKNMQAGADESVLLVACATLQNLCHDAAWARRVVSAGVESRLEALVSHSDARVVRYASGALKNLTIASATMGSAAPQLSSPAKQAVRQRELEANLEEFGRRRALKTIGRSVREMDAPSRLRRILKTPFDARDGLWLDNISDLHGEIEEEAKLLQFAVTRASEDERVAIRYQLEKLLGLLSSAEAAVNEVLGDEEDLPEEVVGGGGGGGGGAPASTPPSKSNKQQQPAQQKSPSGGGGGGAGSSDVEEEEVIEEEVHTEASPPTRKQRMPQPPGLKKGSSSGGGGAASDVEEEEEVPEEVGAPSGTSAAKIKAAQPEVLSSEANRTAAEEWLQRARERHEAGDDEAAVRFCEKSLRLCESSQAQSLLQHLRKFGTGSAAAMAVAKVLSAGDHYEVLGIERAATEAEVKKAYKKLSLTLHPDRNHANGAEAAFKRLSESYSTIQQMTPSAVNISTPRPPEQPTGGRTPAAASTPPMPPMSAGFATPRTHASSADGSPPFGEPQQPMSGDGTPRAGPPVRRRRWEKVLGLGKKRASVERD